MSASQCSRFRPTSPGACRPTAPAPGPRTSHHQHRPGPRALGLRIPGVGHGDPADVDGAVVGSQPVHREGHLVWGQGVLHRELVGLTRAPAIRAEALRLLSPEAEPQAGRPLGRAPHCGEGAGQGHGPLRVGHFQDRRLRDRHGALARGTCGRKGQLWSGASHRPVRGLRRPAGQGTPAAACSQHCRAQSTAVASGPQVPVRPDLHPLVHSDVWDLGAASWAEAAVGLEPEVWGPHVHSWQTT